eukprot:CAMPEP_0203644402 /NCGR_PEP_ID=MMETSP0088-20131115/9822_1 /ASSEMBLY_ACC=CAM_ASM_001087 /TAXON_ID=426623 /ORGANISM="Chaetoceros affinis, Strain CCMP159" /LENGTH=67 /DNA_ID=CAMNT_0050500893 /DNA_START=46 /DNA_END=249 /DNA_ORIENTATION=+
MGNCCLSNKTNNTLSHLDDSVKVMVRHDTEAMKKKGQKPGGYVPRAPHPILDQKSDGNKTETAAEPS